MLPIFKAFSEGKVIEIRDSPEYAKKLSQPNNWTEVNEIAYWPGIEYRIKPSPKYRSFKNANECWAEMQKHQPVGWLRDLMTDKLYNIQVFDYDDDSSKQFYINGKWFNYDEISIICAFADGTPFGIKE